METVYGKNTVTNMSGKAVPRALRGHFLFEYLPIAKRMEKMLKNCMLSQGSS